MTMTTAASAGRQRPHLRLAPAGQARRAAGRTLPQQAVLRQRRVYILPTRLGFLLALMLLVMLLGSLNYNNSMAFVFTFLLAGIATVALWQTQRNLLGLEVDCLPSQPVFAGQEAAFNLRLRNPSRRTRYAIACQWQSHRLTLTDIPPFAETTLPLLVLTEQRGTLRPGRFRLFTQYPMGLFQAWSPLRLGHTLVVLPKPAAQAPPPPTQPAAAEALGEAGSGEVDFAGLRDYLPGDPLRHVAWKAYARSETVAVKQFAGSTETRLDLAWEALPSAYGTEQRLAILTRWVLDAHAAGMAYCLSLPGNRLGPAAGDTHRWQCLTALAQFGEQE